MPSPALLAGLLMAFACAPSRHFSAGAGSNPGDVVIPTTYYADAFFATPVTAAGDTLSLFLDTAGGTVVWEPTVARLGLPVDSVRTASGAYRKIVGLPQFAADRAIPGVQNASLQGNNLLVYSLQPGTFGELIAKHSSGQMGSLWFDGRVWTLDYPRHRVLLRTSPPPESPSHTVAFNWPTDSLGAKSGHVPRIPVVVERDTLQLLMDTGATVWLTDDALAQLHDGMPSQRAVSLVRQPTFDKWRSEHPEWRFIAKADVADPHADMIEVPVVRIGGYDVGPAWFALLPGPPPSTFPARFRNDGTLGGSVLKYLVVTLDYPHSAALFERP